MSAPANVPFAELDAIVFDLGGVILDLDFSRTVSALTELFGRDASPLYTQLDQVPLFDHFEKGEISAADFRNGLRQLFEGPASVSDGDIDAAWNALLGDVPEEKLQLLERLRAEKRTFLLSNTNSIHLGRVLDDYDQRHAQQHGAWASLFERDHYSHLLGLRKPDAAIFTRLLELHRLDPTRTLFIDDNAKNVATAQALGMYAILHPTNAPLTDYFP